MKNMNADPSGLEKWKIGVHKAWLLLIAGIFWLGVGLMLDIFAYSWLRHEILHRAVLAAGTGFVLALLIHHFGFLRIVDRNLNRILPMEGKRCIFSFISWRSYLLIGIMILMGYSLRHSPLPRLYLAMLYSAIGTGLFLSSFRYLRYMRKLIKGRESHY
jgi:hypothetical protein